MEELKGTTARVLRDGSKYDSTNNGISSKFDELIVIGEDVPKRYKGNEDNSNVLKIVKRTLFGSEYLHAEPVNKPAGVVGPMFGGNFIDVTGSMYGDVSKYPIAIHDRFETVKEYETYSN